MTVFFQYLSVYFYFCQVPQLFLDGKYIGGEKEITLMHQSGELGKLLVTSGALK